MQIGDIVGKPGEKVRGRLVATYTTSQMPVEIPVTIVMGSQPGRTLVVTAALHGREMLGPLGLGKVLREIDPAEMSGNLIAVPCVNMSGFEFAQRNVLWDDADPNRQKAGKKDGTVTQQLVYHLFNEVILKGDAHIDIHSSSSVGLVWYTIYHAEDGSDPEVIRKAREMCLAFGLEQVMGKTPWHGTINEETVKSGIPAMTPEVGGGGDFYQNGRHQIDSCARGIRNVMKLMGILPGKIETESDKAIIWNGHTEIKNDGRGALMLLEAKRGQRLQKGDVFAIKYDPTTGDELARYYAPAEGTVLNTGLVWPHCPPGQFLGVLGDVMEEVSLTTHEWKWD
jgi:uncharacterized protein